MKTFFDQSGSLTRQRLHRLQQPLPPKVSAELVAILDKAALSVDLNPSKRLAILYGSQTGTAETLAKTLGTFAASGVPILNTFSTS